MSHQSLLGLELHETIQHLNLDENSNTGSRDCIECDGDSLRSANGSLSHIPDVKQSLPEMSAEPPLHLKRPTSEVKLAKKSMIPVLTPGITYGPRLFTPIAEETEDERSLAGSRPTSSKSPGQYRLLDASASESSLETEPKSVEISQSNGEHYYCTPYEMKIETLKKVEDILTENLPEMDEIVPLSRKIENFVPVSTNFEDMIPRSIKIDRIHSDILSKIGQIDQISLEVTKSEDIGQLVPKMTTAVSSEMKDNVLACEKGNPKSGVEIMPVPTIIPNAEVEIMPVPTIIPNVDADVMPMPTLVDPPEVEDARNTGTGIQLGEIVESIVTRVEPEIDDNNNHGILGSALEFGSNFFTAGFKMAGKILGDESDLEPRSDTIKYNGYEIRIIGRELLLEALYTNCDRHSDFPQHIEPIRGGSSEFDEIFPNDKSRLRICVKLCPYSGRREPKIDIEEGRWTLLYGQAKIDIYTPNGVSPSRVKISGPDSGLILIECP